MEIIVKCSDVNKKRVNIYGEVLTEIIRCKECKKKGTESCPMKIWNYTWGEYEFFNDVDDFCSYGKRSGQ